METLVGTLLGPVAPDQCNVTARSVVRIGDDGRIAEIGTGSSKAGDVIGDEDTWILPGFIDAHLHLPQWDRRGLDGFSLLDWYERVVYPAELRFKDTAFAERLAEDFVTGLVARGTTTVSAFGSPFAAATGRAMEVFARRGFRAIYGMMLNDHGCPAELRQDTDKALDQSRELAAQWHGKADGRLQYAFSPRMPMFCTEKLMRGAAAMADMLKCYVQTHGAESAAEAAKVRDQFPDQLDDIDVLMEMGLLTPRTLLGHGVFLHQERHVIAESRTAVIHCPTADLFLENGLMDYVGHRTAGIRMALGSSIAGGPEPFMPRVAVECLQVAKALKVHGIPRGAHQVPSPAEAWWVLTRGGAEALSLGDRVGAVEQGLEADLLVVRPEPWIASLPAEQQISALLYTISPEQIEHVFIAGQRVGP